MNYSSLVVCGCIVSYPDAPPSARERVWCVCLVLAESGGKVRSVYSVLASVYGELLPTIA